LRSIVPKVEASASRTSMIPKELLHRAQIG
jgi:hypothetical protein